MSHPICRLYGNAEAAAYAAAALRAEDFEHVFEVSPGDAVGEDGLVEAIAACYVPKADARILAKGVARGGSLVVGHAPFGTALLVAAILDDFGPIPSGLEKAPEPLHVWDEAAPLSSALMLPVLLPSDESFSRFWSLPAIIRRKFFPGVIFGKLLVDHGRSFSPFLGMPSVIGSDAFFSRLIGLPLLVR